jgi:hypothetical protein
MAEKTDFGATIAFVVLVRFHSFFEGFSLRLFPPITPNVRLLDGKPSPGPPIFIGKGTALFA